MGIFLNPGNDGFRVVVRSKIYVDKTGLLEYTNNVIGTTQKFMCVSRPRRFGKSVTAEMLSAYYGKNSDTMFREFPRGRGFADIVYVPNKNIDKPALVIELKWDKSKEGAIAQIKKREYTRNIEKLSGRILLVGINYDKKSGRHECMIEEWELNEHY